ncbi:MAG: DUF4198 domain-containing protein [Anaerolineales bacterium]
MKTPKTIIASLFIFLAFTAHAHVPFLKPNQFNVIHDRLQIESSFTEDPFQADFAMDSPRFSIIDYNGKQTIISPTAKTRAAEYLEPVLNDNGSYRINAGVRKGPKYKALETTDGKLYFADDIRKKQGRMTELQYYSSADTYLAKGQPNYKPQLLNNGVEIIPLSSPHTIKANDKPSFRVYQDGEPVANARVVVAYDNEHYVKENLVDLYDIENERENNLYTDNDGTFTFIPEKAGLVLLFVNIHKKTDDSLWESYNTSLTLEVNLSSDSDTN